MERVSRNDRQSKALRGRKAVFAPSHVHRAFGMNLCWASALEGTRRPDGRRLPGSARRVLELLMAAAALKKGPASQLGLVRLSGGEIPRSTVQDGLKALAECGLVVQSKRGWELKISAEPAVKAPAEIRHQIKGEVSPLKTPSCPTGTEQGKPSSNRDAVRKPSKAALWAKKLQEFGFNRGGSWALARRLKGDPKPEVIAEALDMAEKEPGARNKHALAGFFLTSGKAAAHERRRRRVPAAGKPGSSREIAELLASLEALKASRPSPEREGYLDHLHHERAEKTALTGALELALGPKVTELRQKVERGLIGQGISPGRLAWDCTWADAWLAELLANVA